MAIATTKSQHIPTQSQADLYKAVLPMLMGYANNPGKIPQHQVAGLNPYQVRGEEEAMAGLRRIYQNDQGALGGLQNANTYAQQMQQRALGTQRPGAPASFLNPTGIDIRGTVQGHLGGAPQTGGNSQQAMGPAPMTAPQPQSQLQQQPVGVGNNAQPQQYRTPLSPENAPSYQQWQQMQQQGTQPQVTPQGVISQQPTSPQSVPYQSPLPTPPQPQNHDEQWWQDQYHAGKGIGTPEGYTAMPEAEQQAWMQKYGSDSVPYEHWQAFYQQQNPQQQQPAPQPEAAMQRPQQSQGGYDPRTQNTQRDQMMQGVGGGVQGGPGQQQQQQQQQITPPRPAGAQQGLMNPNAQQQGNNPFAGRTLATDPSRVQGGYDQNAMNRQDQYMQGTGGGVQGGPGGGVQAQAGGQPFAQQAGAPPPPAQQAPPQQQLPQQWQQQQPNVASQAAPGQQSSQGLVNPYLQQAMGAVLRPMTEQFTNQALPALRGSALQAGQFGSSRQAVGEGQALNQYVDRASQALSPLASQFYHTGLQGDIQGRLQGNALGAQYDQALLQQAGQMSTAAPSIAGSQHQIGVNSGLLPSQVYSAIGDQRRGIQQQGLDSQYQQQMMQLGWPMTVAQNVLGLTNAIPGGVSQVEQRYSE